MKKKYKGWEFHSVSDLGDGYSFGYDRTTYYYQLEYKDFFLFISLILILFLK